MVTYNTIETQRGLRDDSSEKNGKPSYLRRIKGVLSGENRKKEEAKNAILSHPGVRDSFQYYTNVEEIINDMLNLIKDNYKDYTYSEYKDKRFSYSKFEELFKEKFGKFYSDKNDNGKIVCKIMFQEIAKSFNVEELWDLERVKNMQNFIITDEETRNLYEFYTEEQLWKKTYSMLESFYDNQNDYMDENGIVYSKFEDLFGRTFRQFCMVDPEGLKEICKVVFDEGLGKNLEKKD